MNTSRCGLAHPTYEQQALPERYIGTGFRPLRAKESLRNELARPRAFNCHVPSGERQSTTVKLPDTRLAGHSRPVTAAPRGTEALPPQPATTSPKTMTTNQRAFFPTS
jgi:hypothetical protein